ncbi:hypothetical protein SAMN05216463_1473 [Xylanibacter ruminicola]|uniref:Uncharacterized protein n=1 Tax=Xylanibacter ruminicola TaxID=839 RepID=A0A1M6ZB04_XYLRU|nr:hypothetical protein SAMN05216463_1473 [Xylanibacter ruminicola]
MGLNPRRFVKAKVSAFPQNYKGFPQKIVKLHYFGAFFLRFVHYHSAFFTIFAAKI